jgi:hypothetical protein
LVSTSKLKTGFGIYLEPHFFYRSTCKNTSSFFQQYVLGRCRFWERERERDWTTYTNGRRWSWSVKISSAESAQRSRYTNRVEDKWWLTNTVLKSEDEEREPIWFQTRNRIKIKLLAKIGKNQWFLDLWSAALVWIVQIRVSSFYLWVIEDGRFGGNEKSQNTVYRLKMYVGRGGSAGERNINSATRPKNHGLNGLGSAISNGCLISFFHGVGRCGPGRFHGFGWVLPTPTFKLENQHLKFVRFDNFCTFICGFKYFPSFPCSFTIWDS